MRFTDIANAVSAGSAAPQDNRQTPVSSNPAFTSVDSPNNRLPSSHDAHNDASDISWSEHDGRTTVEYIVGKLAKLEEISYSFSPSTMNDLVRTFGLKDEFLTQIYSSIPKRKEPKSVRS